MSRIKANLTGAAASAICLTPGSPTFITGMGSKRIFDLEIRISHTL